VPKQQPKYSKVLIYQPRGVCPGAVLSVLVDNPRPVEGGIRPDAATSKTDDGSTVTAGTPYPVAVSSPTTSPTLCFVHLGLGGFSLNI
jgi:hypothetical protein